ncbi:MAG: hypothetical protein J6U11_03055 [Campylobacter sp.]|nr:hypothetical protein [Campylobacter sp.]
MDTKLRGRVDGKMIVSENGNQMYIYAQADVMGNKELKNGDIVTFIAQGVRAVEIELLRETKSNEFINRLSEKAGTSVKTKNSNASTKKVSSLFTNSKNNPKVAGFEFMDEKAQKQNTKKSSLTQSYISNIKKYGILSIILPIIFIGAINYFRDEFVEIIKFGLAQINMLNDTFVIIAIVSIFLLVLIFSYIMPLNSAFKNFSYASKSTSILKQNINFNMFFILAFLAVIGCVYYFGLQKTITSLEILGGIGFVLLLAYFYKFKMFFKAGKISGVIVFYIAILIEFLCVVALLAMEILNAYKEFQLYAFGGIALSFLLYIVGYLMVSEIKNDSKNIWNVR